MDEDNITIIIGVVISLAFLALIASIDSDLSKEKQMKICLSHQNYEWIDGDCKIKTMQ